MTDGGGALAGLPTFPPPPPRPSAFHSRAWPARPLPLAHLTASPPRVPSRMARARRWHAGRMPTRPAAPMHRRDAASAFRRTATPDRLPDLHPASCGRPHAPPVPPIQQSPPGQPNGSRGIPWPLRRREGDGVPMEGGGGDKFFSREVAERGAKTFFSCLRCMPNPPRRGGEKGVFHPPLLENCPPAAFRKVRKIRGFYKFCPPNCPQKNPNRDFTPEK